MAQDQWTSESNLEWTAEVKEWNDSIVTSVFRAMARIVANVRNYCFVAKNRITKIVSNNRV